MGSLNQAQFEFMEDLAKLLNYIYAQGYTCSGAELYRTPEQAALNAKKGTGVAKSAHMQRLAIDLNLFKDGIYLQESDAHKPFGDYWKLLRIDNRWGGDFKRKDGNHYSKEYNGIM